MTSIIKTNTLQPNENDDVILGVGNVHLRISTGGVSINHAAHQRVSASNGSIAVSGNVRITNTVLSTSNNVVINNSITLTSNTQENLYSEYKLGYGQTAIINVNTNIGNTAFTYKSRYAKLTIIGAGGGGGGGGVTNTTTGQMAGGGGSGASITLWVDLGTSGSNLDIIVGTGGNGGANSNLSPGSEGTNTVVSINGSQIAVAAGGTGGNGHTSATADADVPGGIGGAFTVNTSHAAYIAHVGSNGQDGVGGVERTTQEYSCNEGSRGGTIAGGMFGYLRSPSHLMGRSGTYEGAASANAVGFGNGGTGDYNTRTTTNTRNPSGGVGSNGAVIVEY